MHLAVTAAWRGHNACPMRVHRAGSRRLDLQLTAPPHPPAPLLMFQPQGASVSNLPPVAAAAVLPTSGADCSARAEGELWCMRRRIQHCTVAGLEVRRLRCHAHMQGPCLLTGSTRCVHRLAPAQPCCRTVQAFRRPFRRCWLPRWRDEASTAADLAPSHKLGSPPGGRATPSRHAAPHPPSCRC